MDRALYLAMSGASEALRAHALQSHNLANASTVGFRADLILADSQPVSGPGHPDRIYVQHQSGRLPDLAVGSVTTTGRDLDVAVDGPGFLVMQRPDGGQAFTRGGALKVDAAGFLTHAAGHSVLGNSGPILLPPFDRLDIGGDGTVSIQPQGQADAPPVVIDRLLLARPEPADLRKDDAGHIVSSSGEPAVGDASVRLFSGALESSNVQSIEALVRMLDLQRQFESQVKLMSTVQDNDRAAARLLRLR